MRALSLVDIACWDAFARVTDKSFQELLGGELCDLPATAIVGYPPTMQPEELAGQIKDLQKRGWNRFKIPISPDLELSEARLRAAREAAPTDWVGFDINMVLRTSEAVLDFEKGELVSVNDRTFDHPSEAIQYLQSIAGPFGIGRDIHVGDTIIGIKGRVGFEAAAPMVILKAHHALEKHVLTKWQLQWKDTLSQFYGNWLHEGQIMDPVMRDIEAYLEHSQENVTGKVFVQLMPYRFQVIGIESSYDLMNSKFGKYGEMNSGFTGNDVRGFSKIFGNQTIIYNAVQNENKKD
jgi:argininosuccinate synthase